MKNVLDRQWKRVYLGSCVEVIRKGLSIEHLDKGEYPIARADSILKGKIDQNCLKYCDPINQNLEMYILKWGDILFSHINSPSQIGKSALYRGEPEVLLYGNNLLLIRPQKKLIDPRYLNYLIMSPNIRKYFEVMCKTGINRASITPIDIKNIQITLPPLYLQSKIADAIEKIEICINKRNAMDEILNKLLETMFFKMFGDPSTNPKNWNIGKIGSLVAYSKPGVNKKLFEEKSGFPILRANNINSQGGLNFDSIKYINLSESEQHKYLVNRGDLILVNSGSIERLGKSAVYRGDEPMAFGGNLLKLVPHHSISSDFISGYLNSRYGKKIILSVSKSRVNIANINVEQLNEIEIYLPPLYLQRKYATIVDSFEKIRISNLTFNKELCGLLDAFMSEYFR